MQNPKKLFNKTYNQHVEKIYRFIFLKVGSQEVAQDLTSEVFLKFWQKLNSKNSEVENPKAFLYQIAKNLVIDHYREKNQARLVSVEKLTINDPNIDLEKDAYLTSEMREVQKALSNLKEDYQDVIIWYYLDELSISEIAEILQRSENAVRLMIHRALKILRKNLNLGS